jgi:5-enolpyruvylshikimate-3-phosphate synthase
MLECLIKLGALKIVARDEETLTLIGTGGQIQAPKDVIYTGDAGTATRFLLSAILLVRVSLNKNH